MLWKLSDTYFTSIFISGICLYHEVSQGLGLGFIYPFWFLCFFSVVFFLLLWSFSVVFPSLTTETQFELAWTTADDLFKRCLTGLQMWGARGKNVHLGKSWVGVGCSLPAPPPSFSLNFRISVYYFFSTGRLISIWKRMWELRPDRLWHPRPPMTLFSNHCQESPGKAPLAQHTESSNNRWVFTQEETSRLSNQSFKHHFKTKCAWPKASQTSQPGYGPKLSTKLETEVLSLNSARGLMDK